MKIIISLALVALTHVLGAEIHPLSDGFINSLNKAQSTWIAGRNFNAHTPLTKLRSLVGVNKENRKHSLPVKQIDTSNIELPENFDAREQWKDCESIGEIQDQSVCGSCWAFGAAEAMTDRICIASKGKNKKQISAEDLLSCCEYCGYGCDGGDPYLAWQYWLQDGIVSGGPYNSTSGCRAYSFPECEHHTTGSKPACGDSQPTPNCVQKCDAGTNIIYEQDRSFANETYLLVIEDQQIMAEIMQHGPVETDFEVYEDFLNYKSGVYQYTSGDFLGGHAVKILGWGVENGTKYWLVANSWNEDWGDKGFFKFLRGENHLKIEEDVLAGTPRL